MLFIQREAMQFVFMVDPDFTASVCHVLAWMNSATECKLLMGLLCTAYKGMILWLPMQRHAKNPPFARPWGGMGFPGGDGGKEPICQCKRHKRHRFDTWIRKIPWRRTWQPIPVFLLGESHGQRMVVGYSP